MNYRRDKKNRQNRRYGILFVILMVLMFTPAPRWFFDLAERPFRVAYDNIYTVSGETNNFLQAFYVKKRLVQENENLQNRIIELENRMRAVDVLESDNANLVELLGMEQVDEDVLGARILDRFSSESLLVNVGKKQGVTLGDLVVAYNNVEIGYVSEIYGSTARIVLYSTVGKETTGILFPTEDALTLRGQGGSTLMVAVPREVEIEKGMSIYSESYPHRILGIIQDVQFDPRDPFQQVYVSAPININQRTVVGVIKQQHE